MGHAGGNPPALAAALDHVRVSLAIVDGNGRVCAANRAFCAETGRDRAAVLGGSCHELLPSAPCHLENEDSAAPAGPCPVRECLESGRPAERALATTDPATAAEVRLQVIATPLPADEDGDARYAVLERRRLPLAQAGPGLRGILPICAQCKNIRNEAGQWETLENYVHEHSEAQFTHGICPECRKLLYPELDIEDS